MKRFVENEAPLFPLGVRAFCKEKIQPREDDNVQFFDAEKRVTKKHNAHFFAR